MHAFPAYKESDILRLTLRNYVALRQHVPGLRSKDLADATRAAAYANSKDVGAIIASYDPPKKKQK
jgi:hypothetical protein